MLALEQPRIGESLLLPAIREVRSGVLAVLCNDTS